MNFLQLGLLDAGFCSGPQKLAYYANFNLLSQFCPQYFAMFHDKETLYHYQLSPAPSPQHLASATGLTACKIFIRSPAFNQSQHSKVCMKFTRHRNSKLANRTFRTCVGPVGCSWSALAWSKTGCEMCFHGTVDFGHQNLSGFLQ